MKQPLHKDPARFLLFIFGTAIAMGMAIPFVWFIYGHGRFPVGSGEVLNWLFGF